MVLSCCSSVVDERVGVGRYTCHSSEDVTGEEGGREGGREGNEVSLSAQGKDAQKGRGSRTKRDGARGRQRSRIMMRWMT